MPNRMRCAARGKGDIAMTWDPAKKKEVAEAKKVFDELLGKGYRAWRVDVAKDKRDETTMLKEFDPEAAEIVVLPPLTGG